MTSQASLRKAAASCRSLRDRLRACVEIADVPSKGAAGPLAGLPIAIKDMIDMTGRAPTLGLAKAPQ